jgi:hypothetical protein
MHRHQLPCLQGLLCCQQLQLPIIHRHCWRHWLCGELDCRGRRVLSCYATCVFLWWLGWNFYVGGETPLFQCPNEAINCCPLGTSSSYGASDVLAANSTLLAVAI